MVELTTVSAAEERRLQPQLQDMDGVIVTARERASVSDSITVCDMIASHHVKSISRIITTTSSSCCCMLLAGVRLSGCEGVRTEEWSS